MAIEMNPFQQYLHMMLSHFFNIVQSEICDFPHIFILANKEVIINSKHLITDTYGLVLNFENLHKPEDI